MGSCFSSEPTSGNEMGKSGSKYAGAAAGAKATKATKQTKQTKDKALENISEKAKNTKIDPQDIDFGYKRHFHDEYEVSKLLGKGAFASVYQVTPRSTSPFYGRCDLAVKVISKTSLKTLQEVQWLQQEVDIMRSLGGSVNIVHVYECYESKNHVYILMELCSGGNLFEKIFKGDPYSEKMAAVIMGDILKVAQQCHAKSIVHRDIKPENFLFANKLVGAPLKMTDFGLADYHRPGKKLSEISGTPYYIAPEVIRQSYGMEADNWSCGVVMYVLLTGKTPFHRKDDNKQSYKVVFRRILEEDIDFERDPWPNISASAKDLCKKLLQKNPAKRISAEDALQHEWVKEDNEDKSREKAVVQRLQLFGTYTKFKQVVLYRLAKDMAGPELQELRKTWDKMNFDNVEAMGSVRLLDGLEVAGFTLGEREGSDLLKRIDVLNTGGLTFEEFAAAILDWVEIAQDKGYKQLCHAVFDAFDHNKDGVIDADEMRRELPGEHTDEDLKKMIAEADTNGDGKIDFKEFISYVHEKLGSADMFDKRLSTRYRNSFPRRTNSFLKKLNLNLDQGDDSTKDTSNASDSMDNLKRQTSPQSDPSPEGPGSAGGKGGKGKAVGESGEEGDGVNLNQSNMSLGRKYGEKEEFQEF